MSVRNEARSSGARARWEPLVDLGLAVVSYLLAYRIRFSGPLFLEFLPYVEKTLPIVVASQMAVLVAAGVYGRRSPRAAIRLFISATAGTLVGVGLVWLIHGPTGVSRAAFSADFLLFVVTTATWRTGRALHQMSTGRSISSGPLIDRGAERPTLLGTLASLLTYRELVKNLVLKDLKLKYRGSALGFLWSLVNPLTMIGVYTLAFTYILQNTIPGFVFFLMLGTLAWSFFANSASMSTGAIVDSGGLMKSVIFPRAILPMATVLFNLAQYLLTVLVFLPVMLVIYRVPPSPQMLLFPFFLALQVLFTIGVAFMLSAGTTFFRDVRHLLEIALSILFWLTPILYPIAQVHSNLRFVILLSPLSPFIVSYQQIFYYRQWPDLTVWIVGLTYALGTFTIGAWMFLSLEDQLAEKI